MRSRRRGGIVLLGSLAGYRDGIAVAYYGPFWAMRAALPHMRSRGRGRVINVCSQNGVNAHIGTLEYNAAKEALRALTRTAAREWAPFGVTVNAICPAAKSATFMRALGGNPEIAAFADAMNPMAESGILTSTSPRSRYSWPARTAAASPATRCSLTAAATSTGWPGRPISTWRPDQPLHAGEVVPRQPEGSAQLVRARREGDFDGSTGRDDVALFDVWAVVASTHRSAPQV